MLDTNIQKTMLEAVQQHQSGKLQAAELLYREVLAASPGFPEANHNLGVLAMQSGKGLTVALALFKAAWEADPAHQQHWLTYLKALSDAGDTATADSVYLDGQSRGLKGAAPGATATQSSSSTSSKKHAGATPPPKNTNVQLEAAYEGVLASLDKGDIEGARQQAMALYQQSPGSSAALKAVGLALNAEGKQDAACNALQQALAVDPQDTELSITLGELYLATARYEQAEQTFAHTIGQDPSHQAAAIALAQAQLKQYRPRDAEQSCREALARLGDRAALYICLGEALQAQAKDEDAIDAYGLALQLEPANLSVYRTLGSMLLEMSRDADMLALCRNMLAALPDNPAVHKDLGDILLRRGDVHEAASVLEDALKLAPKDLKIRGNLLFCRNYLSESSAKTLCEESRLYGELASADITAYQAWRCDLNPQRLRVGLVSGDLHSHPVGYFLDNVLASTDRERIEWYVYATTTTQDALTERLRRATDKWQVIAGLDAGECAKRIHDDGPHLLIDLAGHTAHTLLPSFCYRPAPVQASWLGYFATTGLAQMDYFIADPVSIPDSAESDFVETIWHLPHTRLCFSAPQDAPQVSELPALQSDQVTFGCYQQLAKISDAMLGAWASILQALPSAQLRLQNIGMDDDEIRATFSARAAALGIPLQRLSLHGASNRQDYLASHQHIDIALDTFPFTGATTTSEGLWMGVPTITLAGDHLVARQGASIMAAAGLPDWVAHTHQDYINIAIDQAGDLQRLAAVRGRLRNQLANAPLYDAPRFATDLADALWGMWEARDLPTVASNS